MKVGEMLTQVARTLGDEEMEHYKESELLNDFNEALRAVGLVRPDAFAAITKWQLGVGNPQSLPTGGIRILEDSGLTNLGADGLTVGKQALMVRKKDKDLFDLNWRAATPAAVVDEIVYDETTPKEFETYPPTSAAIYVQGRIAKAPTEASASGDDIPCDSSFVPALREWMLYLNLSADDEESTNLAAAADHARMFFNLLNVKMRADLIASPKVRQMAERGGS